MNLALLETALVDYIEKVDPDWKKFHRIADKASPAVRIAFLKAIATLQGTIVLKEVERALRAGSIVDAENAIKWSRLQDDLAEIGLSLMSAYKASAKAAAKDLKTLADGGKLTLPGTKLITSFTLRNELAEVWIAQNAALLITRVSQETMQAVRAIILKGFQEGTPVRAMARQVRQIVGLTERDAQAVLNYRAKLEALKAAGKSPFKTVKLTAEKIDGMVSRYSRKLLRKRSESIAITETIKASNMGKQHIWEEAIRLGHIDPAKTFKRWVTVPDDRRCPYCLAMDGQTVEIRSLFQSGEVTLESGEVRSFEPSLTPPIHPRCRCAQVLEFT